MKFTLRVNTTPQKRRQNLIRVKMDENLRHLLYDDDELSDDEFLILQDAGHGKGLHNGLPYWKYEKFNLEAMREDECKVEFRFEKLDV